MKRGHFYFFAKHTILSLCVAFLLCALTAGIVFGALYYAAKVTYKDRVLPYTYVNSLNVSGKTPGQVEELLTKAT
ncbi:MAG: hypothetical protein UZ21_OP11001000099 [Microgenomates bacterium OLB22]|nr:MAG: hypothetical protein UZ21_OP11001000099 [Microgenomates bacterium OLB22]